MTEIEQPKRKRRVLRVLVIVAIVLFVVIAAAPTVLSFGPAKSIARDALAKEVNGDVAISGVSLGWLSSQSITGLSIKDSSGANTIDADISVNKGLLGLLLSGGSSIDATVSGSAQGTLEADGSNGLAKLFAKEKAASSMPAPTAPSSSAPQAGLPLQRAHLAIDRLALTLRDVARSRTYAIDALSGTIDVDGAAGTANAKLSGTTDFIGGKGTLALKADVANVRAPLDRAKVSCDVAIDGKNIRVPVDERSADFSVVTLHAKSAGLGQSVTLEANAQGTLDGTTASTLLANLVIEKLVAADGSFQFLPGAVKGTVNASKLPTALAQPMLASTSIVLAEDLGPLIESLQIQAPGGGAAAPISISIDAAKAKLQANATLDGTGAVSAGGLQGTIEASPATLARVAHLDVAAPARFALGGSKLAWAQPAKDAKALSTLTGTIEVKPLAELTWKHPSSPYAIALGSGGGVSFGRATTTEAFNFDIALAVGVGAAAPSAPNLELKGALSPNLERLERATLDFVTTVDRIAVELHQTVGQTATDMSKSDPYAIDVRGTAKLSGIDGAAVAAWMPEQRELIEAAALRDLTVDVRNEPLADHTGQRVVTTLGGEPITGKVRTEVRRDSATVDKLNLVGLVGKQLLGALQKASESPVQLAEDARFGLTTQAPVTIVYADLKEKKLPSGLAGTLKINQMHVSQAPGLKSALNLSKFETNFSVDPSGSSAKATGSLTAAGSAPADKINEVTFDVAWKKVEGPSLLKGLSGIVKASGVSVPWIETLTGQAKGRLSTWTGDNGGMEVTFGPSKDGELIHVTPALPRVNGTLDVLAKGELVQVSSSGIAVRVDRAHLAQLIAQPSADAAASKYDFQGDLVVQLTALTVGLPKALTKDGVSYEGASLDLALETQPLGINVQTTGKPPGRLDVPAILTKVTSKDFAKGVTFTATDHGTAPGAAAGPAPVIAINGAVRNLLDAKQQFSAANAVADLDASVKSLPSVFVDLLAATGGKISRSVGDTIDLTAKAQGASKQAGQLAFAFTSPFDELKAPMIAWKNGAVTVTKENPITGSFALSPGMKEDVLYVINPVFADIELAAQRGTMNLSSFTYPLDGDMTKLNGDFRLEIGDLKFKNGQPLSVILGILRNKPDNLEGRIEPLVVTVRKGILGYEDLAMEIGRTTNPAEAGAKPGWKTVIDMRGEIDLTKKPIYATAITTKLPASQLGNFSADVRGFFDALGGPDSSVAKSLAVGVTMYGPLFDEQGKPVKLKQKIALPEIKDIAKDPGKILEQGIKIFEGINKDKKK